MVVTPGRNTHNRKAGRHLLRDYITFHRLTTNLQLLDIYVFFYGPN